MGRGREAGGRSREFAGARWVEVAKGFGPPRGSRRLCRPWGIAGRTPGAPRGDARRETGRVRRGGGESSAGKGDPRSVKGSGLGPSGGATRTAAKRRRRLPAGAGIDTLDVSPAPGSLGPRRRVKSSKVLAAQS